MGRRQRWSASELDRLNKWAGTRSVGEISASLHRSERAIRCQLHRRGLSAKVREGWGLTELREDLQLRARVVLRYAVQGILRVHSAQVCAYPWPRDGHCPRTERAVSLGEAARLLGWSHSQVLLAAFNRRCRLINLRISDASVTRLCASTFFKTRHGPPNAMMEQFPFDKAQRCASDAGRRSQSHHWNLMHACPGCGRRVRGIAFFRHRAHCAGKRAQRH